MRPFLLFAALLVAACHGEEAPQPEPEPAPASAPEAAVCETLPSAACATYDEVTLDTPAREGALLWAKLSAGITMSGGVPVSTKLSVAPDGTVVQTLPVRALAEIFVPPRGLIRAKLDEASLARVRASVDALRPEDAGLLITTARSPRGSFGFAGEVDLISSPGGESCFGAPRQNALSCQGARLDEVRRLAVQIGDAVKAKWRAADEGTALLQGPIQDLGAWPLDEALAAEDGVRNVSPKEFEKVSGGQNGVFRSSGGALLRIYTVPSSPGVSDQVIVTRLASVIVPDDARFAELRASAGRFEASGGTWLGVPLGKGDYPAFRGRDVAIVPANGEVPETLYELRTFGPLDLTNDGPISLP